jgi:hypothetical protein
MPSSSELLKDPNTDPSNWWAPDRCPITMRPFHSWIYHPSRGWVPTYGGPYDSYTIPEPSNLPEKGKMPFHDIEFFCERFDHDEGGWIDGVEDPCIRVVKEETLIDLNAWLEKA